MDYIQITLDPSILYLVEGAPTIKEAWECLQYKFVEKNNDISESIVSHEVNYMKVAKDNQALSELHYENTRVDDEVVKKEKEDMNLDLE